MLREALAKGGDEAARISYEDVGGYDLGKTARVLAAALKTLPHDLILAGVQSDDQVNSATGAMVAGLLDLPHVSVATKVVVQGSGLEVTSELEGGLQRRYALPLPALITVQFGANVPRYAPLPAIMKASRQPIKEIGPAALGIANWDALKTPYAFAVHRLSPPEAKGHAAMIAGSADEQAKKLAQLFREKGFVRR
jgi:electron transfer flavoprotein beta subunit